MAGTETARAEPVLAERTAEAVRRSGLSGRPVLASVSVELSGDRDVAACTFAGRRADEPWFVWEQPERDGFAIGALGAVATVERATRAHRFSDAARICSEVLRDAVRDQELDRPGTGPLWVGGFGFFPDGSAAPEWSSFPAAGLSIRHPCRNSGRKTAWKTRTARISPTAPLSIRSRIRRCKPALRR